jgi:hypothetical protein
MPPDPNQSPHSKIRPDCIRGPQPIHRGKIISIFLAAVVAILWLTLGTRARRNEMFNPAAVAMAHHQYQTDCAQCHDGDGKGGFSKGVSDNACLKCHDQVATIHHPQQKIAKASGELSSASLTLAIFDEGRGKMRSADCMACHVEHRGDAALAAKADSYCLMCHENLKAALPANATSSAVMRITAFNAVNHPPFGREFPHISGKPIDPTVLRFNHQAHLKLDAIGSGPQSCVRCHELEPIKDSTLTTDENRGQKFHAPPRYMQPVSFQRNIDKDCINCHTLNKKGILDVTMPHGPMMNVRKAILDLNEHDLANLASKPVSAGQDNQDQDAAPATQPVKTSPNQEMLGLLLRSISKPAVISQNELNPGIELTRLQKVIDTTPVALDQPWKPDPRLVQFYVVFAAGTNSCVKCHAIIGDSTLPLDASSDPSNQLQIVPTSIPKNQPRRWYVNSSFDHEKHEKANVSCVGCHAAATASTRTSDLLLPDLDGSTALGKNASQSCVNCHHPLNSSGYIAASNCTECHVFHDRSQDGKAATAAHSAGAPMTGDNINSFVLRGPGGLSSEPRGWPSVAQPLGIERAAK